MNGIVCGIVDGKLFLVAKPGLDAGIVEDPGMSRDLRTSLDCIRRLYRAAAREWRLRVLQANCEGYGWS